FWQLFPKPGFDAALLLKESVSSLGELNATVEYAKLNDELYVLMQGDKDNLMLQQFLLDEYFPHRKRDRGHPEDDQTRLFKELEGKILNEDPVEYRKEIQTL